MVNYSVFVSSSDSYIDIWPVFFDLFKKYWPEFSGTIYLNTEEKTYRDNNLNIVCTQIGKQKSFGSAFRKGLDCIPHEDVLLIMIDYIFMDNVNNSKLKEYYDFFKSENLDCFRLISYNFKNIEPTGNPEINIILPPAPAVFFSYQIAIWKKSMLKKMVLPFENPWSSEIFGSKRAEIMGIKMASISKEDFNPIPYHPAGCIHRKKWHPEAIEFLNKIDYKIDFNIRGKYHSSDTENAVWKNKKAKIWNGIRGSWLDIFLKRVRYSFLK